MNKLLKSALLEMKNDGITLDPIADLEHILELDRLSRRMTDLQVTGEAGVFSPSITVGNVTLHRLSLGAQAWLFGAVSEWYAESRADQDMAYLFAMAHSDRPETLWAIQHSKADTDKAIRSWRRSVNIPLKTLTAAAACLQGERKEDEPTLTGPAGLKAALGILNKWKRLPEDYRLAAELALMQESDSEASYGPIIERLCMEYGGSPIDWVWRRTSDEVWMLLEARWDRKEAENSTSHTAVNSRFMRAHRDFCAYKDRLIQLKRAKK